MAGERPIVEVDPSSEIVFRGPFKRQVTSYVRIKNISQCGIVYKVQTTAPTEYCVRPNGGYLLAGREETLEVTMRSTTSPVFEAARLRPRFLILSMLAPPDYRTEQFEELWRSATSNQVKRSKLQCVFIEEAPIAVARKPTESLLLVMGFISLWLLPVIVGFPVLILIGIWWLLNGGNQQPRSIVELAGMVFTLLAICLLLLVVFVYFLWLFPVIVGSAVLILIGIWWLWKCMKGGNQQQSTSTAVDLTTSKVSGKQRQQSAVAQCNLVTNTTNESYVRENTTPKPTATQEQGLCVVCLDKERNMVLMPCFHLCVCAECSALLESCPLCRNRVVSKNKVYC